MRFDRISIRFDTRYPPTFQQSIPASLVCVVQSARTSTFEGAYLVRLIKWISPIERTLGEHALDTIERELHASSSSQWITMVTNRDVWRIWVSSRATVDRPPRCEAAKFRWAWNWRELFMRYDWVINIKLGICDGIFFKIKICEWSVASFLRCKDNDLKDG